MSNKEKVPPKPPREEPEPLPVDKAVDVARSYLQQIGAWTEEYKE